MDRHPRSEEITDFGRLTRSQLMSRIRSKGNATTEQAMVALLRKERLSGWRRHYSVAGRPDFVWRRERVALFLDGCFWHGHGCGRNLTPRTNSEFWRSKIAANVSRDGSITRKLERAGWKVLRIWECEIRKTPEICIERIRRVLSNQVEDRFTCNR